MYDLELEQEQIRLEEDILTTAQNKIDSQFIAIIENERLTDTSFGQKLLRVSIDAVAEGIKEFFASPLRGQYRKDREKLKLFYEGREQVLAYIIVNGMLSTVSKKPRNLLSLSRYLIKHINSIISMERHKENDPKLYAYMDYEFRKRGKAFINSRKLKLLRLKGFDLDNLEATTKLGVSLVSIVMNSGCNIFTKVEAIYKRGQKVTHNINLSDEAMKLIAKHKQLLVGEVFSYSPLITPPLKVTDISKAGGYRILDNIPLVKRNKKYLEMIKEELNSNSRFLSILNNIQQVGWQINTRVYDVLSYIIEHNLVDPKASKYNPKLYGNIPYMDSLEVDTIIKKEDYGPVDDSGRFLKVEDYKRWYKAKTDQGVLIEGITGRRYSYLLALNTAKKFKSYDKLYFTYQFDYRFRLYPIQAHLNPQQQGNLKALLQFAEGQILNEEGLRWLKIHGANCYGWDKAPYEERVRNIDNMEKEIRAIAEDPLLYLDIWSYADSPYEFLAFCFSYNDYLQDNRALIKIPVALDAVCSGIQIYSGLLRDADGGKAVNVINRYEEVEVPDDYILKDGESFVD